MDPRRLLAVSALSIVSIGAGIVLAAPAAANSGTIVANGAPVTAMITAPGEIAQFSFDGTAGDVDNVTASSGTFPGGCDVSLRVVDNFGRVISGGSCSGTGTFQGSITLPGTGTYLVQIVSNNSNTGSVQLQLSKNAPDAAITVNAPNPVTFTATRPGQGRNYAFSGTAGDVINVTGSAGTYSGGCDVVLQVLDSFRRTIAGSACSGGGTFLGSITLPGTGTYQLQVVPANGNNATASLKLQISRNLADSAITVNAPNPVTFTATRPGQGRNYAFSAAAGQTIDVTASAGTYPGGCDVVIQVVDIYGRTIAGGVCAGTSAFLGSITLPGTGTYLLKVIPSDGNTGSLTLQIQDSPPG